MAKYANPRIAVTVPQDTYDVFKEYSLLIDKPLSACVVDIMKESKPMFELIIKATKDAQGDKEKFIETMRESLIVKSSDIMQQSINFKDSL